MNSLLSNSASFTDRRISLKRAVKILAKSNIEVSDSEAAIILDFLYHVARNYNKQEARKEISNLKGKSNLFKK